MNNKIRKNMKVITVGMALMLLTTACGKKDKAEPAQENKTEVKNEEVQVEDNVTKEDLDNMVYNNENEEKPTQEIIEPEDSKPATDVKTAESGEIQAEIKEAKDSRGNADPEIDEFWENNQGEVIENTTK